MGSSVALPYGAAFDKILFASLFFSPEAPRSIIPIFSDQFQKTQHRIRVNICKHEADC